MFLPSETARLVLSYLIENNLFQTFERFMLESLPIQVDIEFCWTIFAIFFIGIKEPFSRRIKAIL